MITSHEISLFLKSSISDSKGMGEVGGRRPDGFDFGNSPTCIDGADPSGPTMIHRTSAGTQGADILLASGFVVAKARAQYISKLAAPEVKFVITGKSYKGGAEYLEALSKGNQPDINPVIKRVLESRDAFPHLDPAQRGFPLSDLEYCTQVDKFDFAMPVTRQTEISLCTPPRPPDKIAFGAFPHCGT